MNNIILFTTGTGYKVTSVDGSLFEAEEMVEGYRKAGWTKILSEYVPLSNTRVTILAKGNGA